MFYKESIWGLDLGGTCVRVVRLARRGRGFEITAVDRIDTYRDPRETPAEEMDAALRKALALFTVNHRIAAHDRVGVAIPGIGFDTFVVDLPPVAKARIPDLVAYEIEGRLGAAAHELAWGYRELPGPSVNERRVLITAGSSGIVGAYIDALASIGVRPDRLTPAPLAMYDGLRLDGLEVRDAILVRAGVAMTDIVLGLREGPIARTESFGTLWISQTLRDRKGLGFKEAEGERRDLESARGDMRFREVAIEYAERVAERIEAALEFARARNAAFNPSRLVLAGEGARMRSLVELLNARLRLPAEVHTKWNRAAISKSLFGHALISEVPAFSTALGAALDAAGGGGASNRWFPRRSSRRIERRRLRACSRSQWYRSRRLRAECSRAIYWWIWRPIPPPPRRTRSRTRASTVRRGENC